MLRRVEFCLALSLPACAPRLAEPGTTAPSPMLSGKQPSPPLPLTIPTLPATEATASSEPPRPPPPEVASLPELDNSLRKQLGRDGSKRFEFLRSLCPIALQHNRNHWLVGCRVCPPFDDAPPDGKAPEVGFDSGGFYELEGLTSGSFTRPGAEEMAAVFAGCEAADENRGGTLLAERVLDGLWVSRSYNSGLHPNACMAFRRPDGRDLLVCRWADAHQGLGRAGILVQDFAATTAKAGEEGWSNLVTLEDDAASVCMDLDATPTRTVDRWVTTGRIDGFELLPADGSTAGLVVHAHASRGRPTAAFITRCRNWLHEKIKANPRYIDVRPGLNAPALRLVFLWTGNGFEPNAATKAILLQLDRGSEK